MTRRIATMIAVAAVAAIVLVSYALEIRSVRWLDHFTSLVTLISLFVLGPAIGRTLLRWWQETRQSSGSSAISSDIASALSTMIAVSLLIGLYGLIWANRPRSIEWYAWLTRLPIVGDVTVDGSISVDVNPR